MCEHKREYDSPEGFYCKICDNHIDVNEYGYDQLIIKHKALQQRVEELEEMVHGDCCYCQTIRTQCNRCKWSIKESKYRRDYFQIKGGA